MRKDIENGKFIGWSDPRLPTIAGLSGTGIQAEALRNFWIELGVTQKDIAVPLASLYSHNIKIIDDDAPRIAFIRDPVELSLENIDDDIIELPTHPNNPELGSRIINIEDRKVYVERTDLQDNKLRLKEFGDFDIDGSTATLISKERTDKRKIIHWVSKNSSYDARMTQVLDGEIRQIDGIIESHSLSTNTPIQLERIGYGIISDNSVITFTHD